MKRYVKASTGAVIFSVEVREDLYHYPEYYVTYRPYRQRTYNHKNVPAAVKEFIENADIVEDKGFGTIYKMTPPEDAYADVQKTEVSLADVKPEDVLIDTSHGYARVLNYQFKYDGTYRNSMEQDIYGEALFPMGNKGGVQYGVVGDRKKRSSWHGGYCGYKIENGYFWCNNWMDDTKAEAMQKVKQDMSDPSAWHIVGKIA
jgi:hypothetical protein